MLDQDLIFVINVASLSKPILGIPSWAGINMVAQNGFAVSESLY